MCGASRGEGGEVKAGAISSVNAALHPRVRSIVCFVPAQGEGRLRWGKTPLRGAREAS